MVEGSEVDMARKRGGEERRTGKRRERGTEGTAKKGRETRELQAEESVEEREMISTAARKVKVMINGCATVAAADRTSPLQRCERSARCIQK
jgi:hypothetical protein